MGRNEKIIGNVCAGRLSNSEKIDSVETARHEAFLNSDGEKILVVISKISLDVYLCIHCGVVFHEGPE